VTTTYAPSPRPTFDGPAHIRYADVTRHIWGDAEAGEVADWIYASTGLIHCLVFGLGPGQAFRHSREFRTIFGADELLHVLEGTMVIANPETGEVHVAERGQNVVFGPDTWHHAFAHGGPLRVLELYAPPPSAGTSGAYARTKPYLEESLYADDALLGALPGPAREGSMRLLEPRDMAWRLEGGALVGLLASTDQLTTGLLRLDAGRSSSEHEHGGDEVLYLTGGQLFVRAWHGDRTYVFELTPGDACYLPKGARHEYRNVGGAEAVAVFGVAPAYLP